MFLYLHVIHLFSCDLFAHDSFILLASDFLIGLFILHVMCKMWIFHMINFTWFFTIDLISRFFTIYAFSHDFSQIIYFHMQYCMYKINFSRDFFTWSLYFISFLFFLQNAVIFQMIFHIINLFPHTIHTKSIFM